MPILYSVYRKWLPGNAPISSLNFNPINGTGSSLINTFNRAADKSISYSLRSTLTPSKNIKKIKASCCTAFAN